MHESDYNSFINERPRSSEMAGTHQLGESLSIVHLHANTLGYDWLL